MITLLEPALQRAAMLPGIRFGLWWNLALLAGSLLALPFDNRLILGLNPWIKPLKFEISVLIYLITLGLLLTVLGEAGRRPGLIRALGWGFSACMVIENSIIVLQSIRGVRSHMNYTSLFNGIAFGTMGIFIALNTLLLAGLLLLFCVTPLHRPPAEIWGIRLGLLMILAGSVEGTLMVSGGGHTVRAADGGPGLPFLNWSTTHGDLRVAHFFALHALQAFWFAGWLAAFLTTRTSLTPRQATMLTFLLAALYSAAVGLLFKQATRGEPLLALH